MSVLPSCGPCAANGDTVSGRRVFYQWKRMRGAIFL